MKSRKSLLAVGLAFAALSLPFSAAAQSLPPAPAAAAPIDVVAQDVTVTDYVMLLKGYDNELFHSNQARLTADGERSLDQLAHALRNVDYRIIDVTGHADPIGSAHHNQALADQRAATVRAYLAKRGIDADRIFTDGRPIRDLGQCAGVKGNGLRECLAPDRSAEIKVLANAVVETWASETVFDQVEPVLVR